jgi:hypothetical protein
VQQAVRILWDEGRVVSRAGSGVYVRERTERPVGLRLHIARAFEQENVTLDFFGCRMPNRSANPFTSVCPRLRCAQSCRAKQTPRNRRADQSRVTCTNGSPVSSVAILAE